LVDEVGESILFVAPEEEATLSIIEIKLKNEILQEELEGFVTDEELFIHLSKEKTKKPRHQKKKTKIITKKEKF
jgi:hypothetical protein